LVRELRISLSPIASRDYILLADKKQVVSPFCAAAKLAPASRLCRLVVAESLKNGNLFQNQLIN